MWKNHGAILLGEFWHKKNSNAEHVKKKDFLAAYQESLDANALRQASIKELLTVLIKRMLRLCLMLIIMILKQNPLKRLLCQHNLFTAIRGCLV